MASRSTRKKLKLVETIRCPSQKTGYPSKAVAHTVAEMMMDEGRVNPGCHITPYLCTECREWHVANRVIVPVGRKWRSRTEERARRGGD